MSFAADARLTCFNVAIHICCCISHCEVCHHFTECGNIVGYGAAVTVTYAAGPCAVAVGGGDGSCVAHVVEGAAGAVGVDETKEGASQVHHAAASCCHTLS